MFKRSLLLRWSATVLLLGGSALAQSAFNRFTQECVYNLAIQQEIYAMDHKMKYVVSASGTGNKTTAPLKGKYSPKCEAQVNWNITRDGKGFKITAFHPKGTLVYTFTKSTAKITSTPRK